jgi:hypothetical protein
MQIAAQFDVNSVMNLTIVNVQVSTFDLSDGHASLSFFSSGSNIPDTFISNSGSVIITEFSSTSIVGTFDFFATDSLNVTREVSEGELTIGYTTVID